MHKEKNDTQFSTFSFDKSWIKMPNSEDILHSENNSHATLCIKFVVTQNIMYEDKYMSSTKESDRSTKAFKLHF